MGPADFANDLISSIMSDVAPAFWTYAGLVGLAFAYAFVMWHCEGWRWKLFSAEQVSRILQTKSPDSERAEAQCNANEQ